VHDDAVAAQVLAFLAVAAVTLGALALARRRGVPAAVVLVAAGLIIGFLPFVPDATLQPDVVLLGLLPVLLFDAAVTASPTALARHAGTIGWLAGGLTLVTTAAAAAVAHFAGRLPWTLAFVLGAAVAPTDAAISIGIAKRVGLPRKLSTIVGGEALFNDATALVLFAAATGAAATGEFSALRTVGSIAYASVAGAVIGVCVGVIGRRLRRALADPPIEIAGSLLLAYGAFIPARAVHASGVLAVVVAGLYFGWHGSGNPASRLQAAAFREMLVFLIDSALFVLVGMSFHAFISRSHPPLMRLTVTAAMLIAAISIVRLGWIYVTGAIASRRRSRSPAGALTRAERLVVGWSGMRGAITLAALLAVPEVTAAGAPLAQREDLVYIGFVVILVTLIGQGLTLPLLVRRLRLTEHPAVADAEREARLRLTEVVLDRLDALAGASDAPAGLIRGLHAQYLSRRGRLVPDETGAADMAAPDADPESTLRRELVALQRDTLADLRREGTIGVTAMRAIERDLDLEEHQLRA
jgi:CPA1 family monovalent cation:H+ antiporter